MRHVPHIGDDVGGLRRLQGGDLRNDELKKSERKQIFVQFEYSF